MPLYECRQNAENKIKVDARIAETFECGTETVLKSIAQSAKTLSGRSEPVALAFDGWVGVEYAEFAAGFADAAAALGLTVETVNIYDVYKDKAAIQDYKRPFMTDDPCFGFVNRDGRLADLMDAVKTEALAKSLRGKARRADVTVVYGPGSTAGRLKDCYSLQYYFEITRQPLLWKMWDGKLTPLAARAPSADYGWKEYYYCDYYLLHNHKNTAIKTMDYYVEAVDGLKMLPRESYDAVIKTMLEYPIKEVKIFQPGPWGAYRYKDFWKIPGLECNAWNELAGPELSILIDIGAPQCLNIPFVSLMQYSEKLVGKHLSETYPELFPLDIWLDDGYFPTKTPAERISMPIHNHPSTDYVKRHFNEPIGRYETYYIAEAYEGANTWMGYHNHCDLEDWEAKCRASDNKKPIADWKDYIRNWDSAEGDLYLIPPGTAHGHGGNQMVLEMDTCPSIAGTEYSFFEYDFARPSWDDAAKSMTGKPVKMQLEHSFDNEKWRREDWVKDNLLAKPKTVRWTKEYVLERYSSVSEMPFEIERFHFSNAAQNDTEGRFLHILTLTVGKRVAVVSKADPSRRAEIDLFQSAVIPASFGEYEIQNADGGRCTVVQLRWKKG
ncbi:hypothetical protein FACS1894211_07600 [Clostridia bacterium]|nr:hypothetical protein FACS1894211_07600 [Clostridia bacterium]